MKKTYLLILISSFFFNYTVFAQCPENFHDFSALDIHGVQLDMSVFAGKKVLVVNTASFCGYTPQYESLQQLYETYGGKDFEIIGFPSNDFNQEPNPEDSIIGVCEDYGVTFTMMSKVGVKAGANQHEIYQWLTQSSRNCVQNAAVAWNFQKFLINADGSWHATVSTQTSPLSPTIVDWILSNPSSIQASNDENTPSINVFTNQSKQVVMDMDAKFPQKITVQLYDMSGRLMKVLHDGNVSGTMHVTADVNLLSQGIYLVKITGKDFQTNKKVLIY